MRSTLEHLQIASYLERGIQDTLHGTLQANRDLDDPDRLQTKIEADLSMFTFGAQLHALSFLSRQDQISSLNAMKGGFIDVDPLTKKISKHSPYYHAFGNSVYPADWVYDRNKKSYVWKEDVDSEKDIINKERFDYVGKGSNEITSHFESNLSILDEIKNLLGTIQPNIDKGSYLSAKLTPKLKESIIGQRTANKKFVYSGSDRNYLSVSIYPSIDLNISAFVRKIVFFQTIPTLLVLE